ncbi:hypothetical protein HJC23_011459 [Cyclotella cryptica]|uniref:NADH:ubiquinone oxidoreductase intermediate-associated protein 30 domain-containing protein n=1 Tax=Cyclotella cryptica TaxID=29204 RepID=A0ABD3NSK0_9STRA
MVRQLFFPKEGGGPLRRFLGIRQSLYRDALIDDRPIRGPVQLFDFRRTDDAADLRNSIGAKKRGLFAGWRVSDDSVIGGYSTSRMEFIGDKASIESNSAQNPASEQLPFLRWSGTINTEINRQSPKARHITRSGFAAILSPEYPFGCPLGNRYRALEICCRTDGRTYAVNLHVETFFPEDMYQGFIGREGMAPSQSDRSDGSEIIKGGDDSGEEPSIDEPNQSLDVREYIKHRYKRLYKLDPSTDPVSGFPPSGFQRLILPFKGFTLTSRGRARHEQRDLDGAVSIESIGFTLMDGKDGDFTFDLVSVRAVNVLEGEIVGTLEDEARESEIEQQFRREAGKETKIDENDDLVVKQAA